eukprot:GHVT01068893.1.p1 GENE.GHVT01068893.1~~GHVT01068893.1.p1  ORF type:complete len:190 (-),score=42.79 GHVT01068893.1:650-1219(-)
MSAEAGEASAALPVSLPLRCQALLSCGATRFDPSSIPTLVESVKEQIANESYDGDANLAMFKLFGMYPKLLDLMACRRGLVKAIMQLPASDATECIYLIPEATQNHPLIKPIITLEKNLQNCYFKKVWKTLEDKHMKDVAEIKGLQVRCKTEKWKKTAEKNGAKQRRKMEGRRQTGKKWRDNISNFLFI